jgi:hypothetical protein
MGDDISRATKGITYATTISKETIVSKIIVAVML